MTLLIWLAATSLLWGGVLWMTGRLLQRSNDVSGRARQWIWRGATLLLVAPWIAAPLVIMFGLGLAPAETVAEAVVATAPTGENLAAMHAMDLAAVETAVVENGGTIWSMLASASIVELVLLAVMTGWLVRFVMAQLALRSLLGIVMLSRPAERGVASDAIRKWSDRLKLRPAPRLRVVAEEHSPFSYGVLRPTVCLPEGLDRKLNRESLDLVVGHECLHVARGDGWLRPLERVTADILWFNPFAWLIRRELDVARELAVDEAVVAMAASRVAYARTLRDVAGISAGLPTGAPAATMALAGGRSLMMRVSRTLAQAKRKPTRAAILAALMMGVVGAPIAVAQVMMVVPAPPAPPAAPSPIKAPAPMPPVPPEAPAAAEFDSKTGEVRTTFAAKVVDISGSATNGYRVELLQTAPGATGETCLAQMDGLGSLSVSRDQLLKSGDLVGSRAASGKLRLSVSCSDALDGQGRPKVGPAPEPPAPPSPVSAVAPAAPAMPASPVSAPAPVAVPAPPSPVMALAPVPPAAPAALVAPSAAPRPLSAVAMPTPPAPPAPYVPSTTLSPAPYAPQPPQPPAAPQPLRQSGSLDIGPTNQAVLAVGHRSSPFGERRDPAGQGIKQHSGVDIAAPRGVVVRAPVDARVVRTGAVDGYGNLVELQLDNGYVMRMSQLDEIKVATGARIAAGVVVGTVGSSGASTGPHLHFEVLVDGKPVNPEVVKGLTLIARQ